MKFRFAAMLCVSLFFVACDGGQTEEPVLPPSMSDTLTIEPADTFGDLHPSDELRPPTPGDTLGLLETDTAKGAIRPHLPVEGEEITVCRYVIIDASDNCPLEITGTDKICIICNQNNTDRGICPDIIMARIDDGDGGTCELELSLIMAMGPQGNLCQDPDPNCFLMDFNRDDD